MATGMILINKLYAKILFVLSIEWSYIIPKFRQLLNHPSSDLRETYIVEMANGQVCSTQ